MGKNIEYYLSKGLDPQMAEYFSKGRKTLIEVKPLEEQRLLLIFDGSEKRILDLKAFIQEGTVFSFLMNPENFNRVYLDEMNAVCWDKDPSVDSSIIWDNKVDISPDSCYVDSVPV